MDKKTVFLFLFLAATGVTTGCFFEIFLSGSGKEQLMSILSGSFGAAGTGLSHWSSFWQNLCSGAFFLLLCFFSPKLAVLLLLGAFILFFRGLALGFSAAMMMETFGYQGILYVALTLAPAGLLQILLYASFLARGIQERHRRHGNRKALRMFTGPYLHDYVAGLVILLLICLLQSALIQAVT